MEIEVNRMHFRDLNEKIRNSEDKKIVLHSCVGQRFIGDGIKDKEIIINGVPGNGLGAYLDGGTITVNGNAQDASGDTMNEGEIRIHGMAGDGTGYGMRGGRMLIQGDVGYRCGIHMKAYQNKFPVMVVGGRAGSFLGEYQAGGRIIVLGLNGNGTAPVGYFCGTGQHGGKIFLRCQKPPKDLVPQICCEEAKKADLREIKKDITDFCKEFGYNPEEILSSKFYVLTPNSKSPYKKLYAQN